MNRIHYFEKSDTPLYPIEFAMSHVTVAEKRIGPRVRSTYLLHFVIEGEGVFCGKPIAAGDAFLIARDRLHEFIVFGGYRHYWVAFDGEGAENFIASMGLEPSSHALFHVKNADEATKHLASLHAEKSPEAAIVALGELLARRERIPEHKQAKPSDAARAARYLADNYHKSLTIKETARHVGLSENYLCRIFSASYGMPPRSYLLKLRMEKAAEMLTTTDLTIKSIAISVGYPSQLAFSEMFRRYHGISPSAYRGKGTF